MRPGEIEPAQPVWAIGNDHLPIGLAPFVETRMKARHGTQSLAYGSRATGGDPRGALDEYGLLKTMIDNWRDAFDEAFGRNDKHRVRNFTSMALDARNGPARRCAAA